MEPHLKLIIADCETPSLKVEDGVVEVAFMEIDYNAEVISQESSLIDPEVPITPGAAGVHGIRDVDVADAPTLEEYMTIVKDQPYLKDEWVFIGHNSKFDFARLGHWFNSTTQLCTLRLARKLWPESPDHKLQTLRMYLNLPFVRGDAHSALGDVEVCRQILKLAMQEFGYTMEELIAIANEPVEITTMPFGKHRGVLIKDLPAQYKSWALKNLDLEPDLRKALEA